jgi:uncharacterized peroxidase-related enzyme
MAFIKTIPSADADGELRAMYERQQAAWGYVPNYAKVFCHRPEVLARWGRLLAEIRRPMDARRFELITFAAAHALRHTACALTHGKALAAFLGEGEVLALAAGDEVDGLTAAETAMLNFARKVALDAASITAGDVAALRAHGFSDPEIFDIAATAAGRAFFTKLLDALGVEADSTSRSLSPEFREALTVGRPIDFRDVEVMPAQRGGEQAAQSEVSA